MRKWSVYLHTSLLAAVFLLVAADASAQTFVRLWPNGEAGTITTNGGAVTVSNGRGMATVGIDVRGTFDGTLALQCTTSTATNATYTTLPVAGIATPGTTVSEITAAGTFVGSVAGCVSIQVAATAWTSGSARVELNTVQVPLTASTTVTLEGEVTIDNVGITSFPDNEPFNLNQVGGTAVATGAGNTDAGTQRVVIATNQAPISVTGDFSSDGLTDTELRAAPVVVDLGSNNDVTVASLPLPSGASTAANQSTANTTLSAIQTAVQLLDNAVAGNELQVDVVTSALPTGASTAANQSTANTALSAIQTAVQLLDNAVSGSELQVDVVTSGLPTGAATAANQTTANTALSAIQTAVEGTVDVNIVSGAGSGGTALADDADFTAGTTSFTPSGGFYQSTVTACTDGDACAFGITANRAVRVALEDAAGNPIGEMEAGEGTITADTSRVTIATDDGIHAELDAIRTSVQLLDNAVSTTNLNVICTSGCGGSGGTSAADDADFTAGTTDQNLIGGVYQSTPTAVTDGDQGAIGITATRAVRVALEDADGVPIGVAETDEGVITADTQRVTIATDDSLHAKLGANSRDDTFTETGNGTTVDLTATPRKSFGLQVIGTGDTPSAWTVVLQVSLNGTTWVTLLTHSSTDSDPIGSIVWNGANLAPARYMRSSVTALTLGSATNVVATIIGMN